MELIEQERLYDAYQSWKSLQNIDDADTKAKCKTLQSALIKAARIGLREADECQATGDIAEAVRLRRDISRMEGFKEAPKAKEALEQNKDEINAIRLMEIVENILANAPSRPEPSPEEATTTSDAEGEGESTAAEPADGESTADDSCEEEEGVFCDDPNCDGRHTGEDADELLGLAPLPDVEPPTRVDQAARLSVKHQRVVINKLQVLANYYADTITAADALAFLAELQADPRLAEAFSDKEVDDEPAAEADNAPAEPKQLRLARMYRRSKLYEKALRLYREVVENHPDTEFAEQATAEIAETEELKRIAEEEAETAEVDTNY